MSKTSEKHGTKHDAPSRSVHRRAQSFPAFDGTTRNYWKAEEAKWLGLTANERASELGHKNEKGENWYEAQQRLASNPVLMEPSLEDLTGHPENREKMKGDDSPFHFDSGKARMDQIPPLAMEAISQVFGYGAKKYGEHNWARYANDWKWGQMIGSMIRHIFAWMRRENLDPESGMHHLAHAGCNVMMLLELVLTSNGKDDRNPMHRAQEIGAYSERNTTQATYREPRSYLVPGGDPSVSIRPGVGIPPGRTAGTNRTWRPPQHD